MAMSGMPMAMRRSSWVLPQVPTMLISMLRQSVKMNLSPRTLRAVWHARNMSSQQSPSGIALGKAVCEGRDTPPIRKQGKIAIRNWEKIQQGFFPSPTIMRLRKFSAEATADMDKIIEDKAGGFAISQRRTLKELCDGLVPRNFLERAEEIGFMYPTQAQEEALPVLLSCADCLLHAQVELELERMPELIVKS